MTDQPFDYQNPAHYFRIAFASVRRHAERKGLSLDFDRLEDLASDTLVRFYELRQRKNLDSAYAIPEIARYILLESLKYIDPTVPLLFDLAASPLPWVDTVHHEKALAFIFDTLTPTERIIADAFLRIGDLDHGRIAELAGTIPANVSKYLNKMRSRIDRAISLYANQAALELLSDTPSDVHKCALLGLARSAEHYGELTIRLGAELTRTIRSSLTSYAPDPHHLVFHVRTACTELSCALDILEGISRKPVDPSLIHHLSTQFRLMDFLARRTSADDVRTTTRIAIASLKSHNWTGLPR